MVEEEGSSGQIFYSQHVVDESWRGDLVEFVRYFGLDSVKRNLLVMQCRASGRVMGMVWFDEIVPGYLGAIGLFYRKEYRGKASIEATKLACDYACDVFKYIRLVGFSPHKHALHHIVSCGWQHVCTVPKMTLINGNPRDIYVAMQDRSMLCQEPLTA
ncbi:MAG: GNAT family N-acetyltransferase [Gammaproteobacteria bacterium]